MTDASQFVHGDKATMEQGRAVAEGQVIAKAKQKRAPRPRQIKAAQLFTDNVRKGSPKAAGEILREAGYAPSISQQPGRIINADSFQDLLAEMLPDDLLQKTHKKLLTAKKIEHMVFPLWQDPEAMIPEEGDIPEEYLEQQGHGGALKRKHKVVEGASLSDDDITEMLLEVNCTVRKIVHGETARHVYYWADDAKSQHNALELAYRLKGHLTKADNGGGINFNLFTGGQTFVNPGDQE